jgi:KDPG/KHG aldolase
MSHKELLVRVCQEQIIGVVREDSAEAAAAVADAYARNGIRILEVTLTTPDALDLITTLVERFTEHDVVLGAPARRSSFLRTPMFASSSTRWRTIFCASPAPPPRPRSFAPGKLDATS